MEGMGSVMKMLAMQPRRMQPYSSLSPMAAAELMVAAFNASAGSRPIFMHASDTMNFMSPEGVEPGL